MGWPPFFLGCVDGLEREGSLCFTGDLCSLLRVLNILASSLTPMCWIPSTEIFIDDLSVLITETKSKVIIWNTTKATN